MLAKQCPIDMNMHQTSEVFRLLDNLVEPTVCNVMDMTIVHKWVGAI